jgi:hypothetical protein
MLVGAARRDLMWTPELAAHWATIAQHALSVVSVTPTSTPMLWVDAAQHSPLPSVAHLALQTATWEATCRWLALLTPDLHLAETFLCLEIRRPLVYPVVIHFHLMRHSALLAHIARGGAFHLAMEPSGQVIPFLSVSAPGLGEQMAVAEAFGRPSQQLRSLL